jgi:predicted nucleotidyltransferase
MAGAARTPFEVIALLQERGIRLFIVGGYAVNALGYSRNTNDVDCLIVTDDLPKVNEAFREKGFSLFGKEQTHARYFSPDSFPGLVDVLLVNSSTFEKMWLERVPATIQGHPFHVPRLEHIIAMKLHATRNQSQRRIKDLLDISELLRANSGLVSSHKMRELCEQFGPPGKTEEILKLIYGDGEQ